MLTKRNYKLTPDKYGFKAEMWNDFGMKRTIYSENVVEASEYIIDWWEKSEEEFDKMNSLNNAIHECVQIDKKAGRIPSLD